MFVSLGLLAGLLVAGAPGAPAQSRGRKYKAPPATSHIEVDIVRNDNGKPVANAGVVFNSEKDGKSEGNLEVKSNEEGKAIIDVIPTGSKVTVQVIADGFATFADDYQVNETDRTIQIKLLKPRAQVSTYVDNSGKPAVVQPGIQEPHHAATPTTVPVTPAPAAPAPASASTPVAPPTN